MDYYRRKTISIHVPREGHDFVGDVDFAALNDISIHVPREGHDPGLYPKNASVKEFQSTCPARGTTKTDIAFFSR